MDRKRLVAKILMEKGWAVQSKGYREFLPLGRPAVLAEFYDEWQVDEIVLVEKSLGLDRLNYLKQAIESVVEVCRTPLTVCGGIKDIDDALQLIRSGADRVALNSALIDQPQLASSLKSVLGRQAVVGQIDFTINKKEAFVYDYRTHAKTNKTAISFCEELVEAGVGEILLHSVDRDGSKTGYELDFYSDIANRLDVPIIASGGYGKPEDANAIIKTGVQAFSIGNSLSYTEHAATVIKAAIKMDNKIRKTSIYYNRSQVSSDGRLIKKEDDYLDSLRFKKRDAIWM